MQRPAESRDWADFAKVAQELDAASVHQGLRQLDVTILMEFVIALVQNSPDGVMNAIVGGLSHASGDSRIVVSDELICAHCVIISSRYSSEHPLPADRSIIVRAAANMLRRGAEEGNSIRLWFAALTVLYLSRHGGDGWYDGLCALAPVVKGALDRRVPNTADRLLVTAGAAIIDGMRSCNGVPKDSGIPGCHI